MLKKINITQNYWDGNRETCSVGYGLAGVLYTLLRLDLKRPEITAMIKENMVLGNWIFDNLVLINGMRHKIKWIIITKKVRNIRKDLGDLKSPTKEYFSDKRIEVNNVKINQEA